MKAVSANRLEDRYDRACARLAMLATLDTIHGGARAAVLADRLERMHSRVPAQDIVSDVYSQSTGRTSIQWGAWECPECGSVHLGQDAAAQCCYESPCDCGCEDDDVDDDDVDDDGNPIALD